LICGGTGVAVGSGVAVDVGSGVGVLDGVGVFGAGGGEVGVMVAHAPPTTPHPLSETAKAAHTASVAKMNLGRGTEKV
jgi:hypothetical protein